ncbi:excinuclease ABC subunit UvrC [Mycoplasma sp. P36-A1]|uniref:excinuclease ABC subunit UvrC n=1 Tax=Mycoplasma sp. P36-A1 TaxID=3252900 RepID=UPI003C2F9087
MTNHIKTFLTTLPHKPGCYLMKNKQGNIIYVGKAKDLKKRVTSYFNKVHNGKTQLLVSEINDIEVILTSTEKESLILEINLIKKHRPKYNIMFMDDKFYPYIQLTKEKHPKLKVVRNTKYKNATYFGPFPNSGAAWDTLQLINKIYPLRKCNVLPKKECLYYHMHQCLAPCIKEVTKEEYDPIIKKIKSFLNGNTKEIIQNLEEKMIIESDKMNFEMALEYKKLIDSINITTNKQSVFKSDMKDRDYIGISFNQDYISIQIMIMRNGILIERQGDIFPLIDEVKNTVDSYILQYYELNIKPSDIYISQQYYSDNLNELLDEKLIIPQKGDHKKMLLLADENAKKLLEQKYEMVINDNTKVEFALKELTQILKLETVVHRIEAFDNSTLQGENSIGSMVVYEDGQPIKSEYRQFKIKETQIVDDYAFMREVIYRRYYRVLMDDLKKPDLIIVDGGIGQVNIARNIIDELDLKIKVIGLVKDDKHRTSHILDDNLKEYYLDKTSELFFLLTRIQDEVHRYAIGFHRKLRSKSMFSTVLDDIQGLGPVRKKNLLKHFKSYKKLKDANLEELLNIVPKEQAELLYEKLQNDKQI